MNNSYELITILLFSVYIPALLFLFSYGFIQIHLVSKYIGYRKNTHRTSFESLKEFPFVTVQLPVYNESLVIERLIDAVAKFDYPKDRFEVQILDDSTDETSNIIANKAEQYKAHGLQIQHIKRNKRTGFKAGALQEGLSIAKGEFITIFDADFIPPKDFLKRTLPCFADKSIGMVQTRWDHLNKNYSLLTHFQAFFLDAHFSIEQMGRNSAGYFMNFSGTGGIFRKSCITDAGGWHSDTLTEDFDLSYRAQLKGWKFRYLEDVSVPAELPPFMSAYKTQQYRWIKGNVETAKKHLKQVLQSNMPLKIKVNAFFHLMVGMVFICIFLASVVSIPLLFLKPYVPQLEPWFQFASFSVISLLCLGAFHYVAIVHTGFSNGRTKNYFFRMFPLYLAFTMGISLNNTVAVINGLFSIKSAFIRTPKFNISNTNAVTLITSRQKNPLLFFEIILSIYFSSGAALAIYYKDFTMFPYHLMLAFGFSMISYFSIKEQITNIS